MIHAGERPRLAISQRVILTFYILSALMLLGRLTTDCNARRSCCKTLERELNRKAMKRRSRCASNVRLFKVKFHKILESTPRGSMLRFSRSASLPVLLPVRPMPIISSPTTTREIQNVKHINNSYYISSWPYQILQIFLLIDPLVLQIVVAESLDSLHCEQKSRNKE